MCAVRSAPGGRASSWGGRRLSLEGDVAVTGAMGGGKYVCTWKKQKGGTWKAIHDIWNTDAK